jgi:hypothetical protein
MASPYPLPPGCIFREDFKSPALAAQNGLVVKSGASVSWLSPGILVNTDTADVITVPILNPKMLRSATTTIIDAIVADTASSERYMVCQSAPIAAIGFRFGKFTVYDTTYRQSLASPAVGSRALVAVVLRRGGASELYINGIQDGTWTNASGTAGLASTVVGGISGAFGATRYTAPIFGWRFYNYAMSSEEIAADYRTIRGNQA